MMLRRISAVALLCLRTALRSRMVVSLLLLLLLVLGLLPSMTRGDGTPTGEWRVLLTYPLTAVTVILGLATLWAGCAVFAGEIDAGRLQLTRIQPVRPFEIWLGHWLGLVLLNTLLLAVVWGALAVWVHVRIGSDDRQPDSLQQPWVTLSPAWPDPETAVQALMARWRAENRLDPEQSQAELRRELMRRIHAHHPLAPGETQVYPFTLDRPLDESIRLIELRIDLAAGTPMQRDLTGTLTVRDPDSGRAIAQTLDTREAGSHKPLRIDPGPLRQARRLEVVLQSAPGEDRPTVLVGRQAVTLRLPRGSHGANTLRAAFGLLGLMAVLTAVGLLFGAVLSFPVAAFCASITLVVVLLSRFVASQGYWWASDTPTLIEQLSTLLVRLVATAGAPVDLDTPIARLAALEWIPWRVFLHASFMRLVLYPLLLGTAAANALKYREVAK